MVQTSAPGAGLLEAFRKPDFNVAAFVRDATGQGQDRAARISQQLQDASTYLEEELRREIAAHHEELLQSAGSISDLDGQLGQATEIVATLKASVARIRADVLSPFHEVKHKVKLLGRMQAVNILIRKLLRFLFDLRKLRTQMEAPGKDYSKAAHTLRELEIVLQESSLEKVDLLRAEVLWIRESGLKVRRQSEEDLRQGVRQGNQISLSVALQVFFNLQCLWPQLKKVLGELIQEFVQAPLPPGTGFHQALDVNAQVLVAQTLRVHVLDELIQAKCDPVTQKPFASVLEAEGIPSLTSFFWTEVTADLRAKFMKVCQDRVAKKALATECPKVFSILSAALDKLHSSRGKGQALRSITPRESLFAAVAEMRNEFLGESIRRVTDPVEMMLPDKLLSALSASGGVMEKRGLEVSDELPTMHDLRRYVQLLFSELERCESCPDTLLKEVVRSVRSSVLFFATRLEQVVDSSCTELRCFEDANLRLRSPLPTPSAGHARNARVFGIAHHTLAALKEIIPPRFQALVVTEQVQSTLRQTQAAVVSPMVSGLQKSFLTCLARLEAKEALPSKDGTASLQAVSQAFAHIARCYFSLFGLGQLQTQMKDLCVFVIRSFLSTAALIKPSGALQRASLAQDLQIVETMLAALDGEFQTRVRYEAAVLKEFKKLVFAQSLNSIDYEELTNVIPVHLLLTFLFHQLPESVPTLPAVKKLSSESFLEAVCLPLWDEQPEALAQFKATIGELSDKHSLDPTESAITAFIVTHTS